MSQPLPTDRSRLPLLAPGRPYLPAPYQQLQVSLRGPQAMGGPRVMHLEVGGAGEGPEGGRAEQPGMYELALILTQLPMLRRIILRGRGDPLLNEALPDMIGLLKLRDMYVAVESPGTHLTAACQAELLRSLPDELRITLPGVRAGAYGRPEVAESTAQVLAGLRSLAERKARHKSSLPRLSLRCPARVEALAGLPALVRLAAEVGAGEVYLERLVYPGGPEDGRREDALFGAFPPYVDEVLSECEALSVELGVALRAAGGRDPRNSLAAATGPEEAPWQACLRPWGGVYVTATGSCYPCRTAPQAAPGDDDMLMGDLFRRPFPSIWNGPRYQSFRAALLSDRPHIACRGCGVRWSL